MREFTRRNVMVSAAAAGAAALTAGMPAVTRAAAPPTGKQAPGFYRYKVGDFELTQVTDGNRIGPMADGFVRNVPKEKALSVIGGYACFNDGSIRDWQRKSGTQFTLGKNFDGTGGFGPDTYKGPAASGGTQSAAA